MQRILMIITSLILVITAAESKAAGARETNFNSNWQFHLGPQPDAIEYLFDDSSWRRVNLPHDWSVEASFDKTLEGATAYLPGGVGWYRKHFPTPRGSQSARTFIYFDGVYNHARVYLNGKALGYHPYGYSPFYYDLSDHLHRDGRDNVIAVRVDRTRYVDSRWYPGSGIYRTVKLITIPQVGIPIWGTRLTTPAVSARQADVKLQITLDNAADTSSQTALLTVLYAPSGRAVARQQLTCQVPAHQTRQFTQSFTVVQPQLWDIESPNQYRAITSVVQNETVIDQSITPFGIRQFHFDPNLGFFLNGRSVRIKGVCLHHDGGLVGAAVPTGVWRRRLEQLKEAGCNAIRMAHNPASTELLTLCDEMGFLVQSEFFDEWDYPKDKRLNMQNRHSDYISRGSSDYFQQWAQRDLQASLKRDWNHPCIFQWSIGNEIEWTYPRYKHATGYFDAQWSGNYFWTPPHITPDQVKKRYDDSTPQQHVLADTAAKLAGWTRQLDTTRPIIANCILPSASHVTGYGDALDIVGYSYRRVVYDYGHQYFPNQPIMGTENLGQWHEWKAVLERPFIAGLFLWTGIDYLGESNGRWPTKGTNSGLLDCAGFKKPSWHMFRALWNDSPSVYLASVPLEESLYTLDPSDGTLKEKKPGAWQHALWAWHPVHEHWNYRSGQQMIVEVYSNCPQVELQLNGRSLGMRRLAEFEDHIYKWVLPFEPGRLEARGLSDKNQLLAASTLGTAGKPVAIQLTRSTAVLTANNTDVCHITCQLVDSTGLPVKTDNRPIRFSVQGPCRSLGVDNGAIDNVQGYQSDNIVTHQGRALLIIQAQNSPGPVRVTAESDGLSQGQITLKIQ